MDGEAAHLLLLIEGEKWDEITAMCKEAVKTMLGFSLAHVGLNCENEAPPLASAGKYLMT